MSSAPTTVCLDPGSRSLQPPALATTLYGTGTAAAVLMATCIAGASLAQFGALSPRISAELGLSTSQAGLVQASFFLGHFSGSLILGRGLSVWSATRCWLLTSALMVLGALIMGQPWFATLLIGRIIMGAGFSSTILLASASLVAAYPQRSATMLSLMHALVATSAALTLLVTEDLARALGHWTYVCWLASFLAVLMGAMMWRVKLPPLAGREPAGPRRLCQTFTSPMMRRIAPAIIGYLVIEQTLTIFLPQIAFDVLQMSSTQAGTLAAALWIGIIGGRFAGAALVRQENIVRVVLICGLIMGTAVTGAVTTDHPLLAHALVFLAGFWGGPIVPLMFALAAARSSLEQRAAVLTCCQLSACVGGLTGPALVGLAAAGMGLVPAVVFAALAVCLGVLPLMTWADARRHGHR